MEKYIINGQEVEWDTFDIANMTLYDGEVERVAKEAESLKEQDVTSENYISLLKEQCENIIDFFACVLGEETAERLFHGRVNVQEAIAAYRDFTRAVTKNRQGLALLANDMSEKQPDNTVPLNREQRRRLEREQRRKEAQEKAKRKERTLNEN